MRVGIVFDLFSDYPSGPQDPPDADAENEPEETVQAIADALRLLGHEPVRIGTPASLLEANLSSIDAAVNIAEGAWTRNREGWAPTILEMRGIPFTGSDALALSLSLDKALTKDVVAPAGVNVLPHRVYAPGETVTPDGVPAPFPLFVKPRYEGAAKGLGPWSRVGDLAALAQDVARTTRLYGQDALVEPFIDGGGEFTVAVMGDERLTVLPALQRAVDDSTGIGLHAVERRGSCAASSGWSLPGSLDHALETEMGRQAVAVFRRLGCRDFARVDFRVDGEGTPWFLEINPLPTFAPDGTFAVLAELTGQPYERFLADVLETALARAVRERPRAYAPPRGLAVR